MPRKRRVNELLDQLQQREEKFLEQEFLAPVLRGAPVRVRIGGAVCRIRTHPDDFEGFGVFQPTSYTEAHLARAASLSQRQEYLRLFPLVRLILCRREQRRWLAVPAHRGDGRFLIDGLVPVELVEDAQPLDVVNSRFDGSHFWFESLDERRDPATAAYLRRSLDEMVEPEDLSRKGLTAEERAAYTLGYFERLEARAAEEAAAEETGQQPRRRPRGPGRRVNLDPIESRLRAALAHAGAEFVGYLEHRDGFRVTYTVGRQQHVTSVNKNDLTVQVAGICLSGQDRDFDLGSLVGVIREGAGGGEVVRVGDEGMNEEEYWRVHPPGNP